MSSGQQQSQTRRKRFRPRLGAFGASFLVDDSWPELRLCPEVWREKMGQTARQGWWGHLAQGDGGEAISSATSS